MKITSAYNFVPLQKEVVQPEWQDMVSHDLPLEDGVCAELDIEITTHTPLLVADERNTNEGVARASFFRYPDGTYAIPGSSVRGMLRNMLEIATYARLAPLMDDRALSLRDVNLPAYQRQLTKKKYSGQGPVYSSRTRGGWLRFDQSRGGWSITECDVLRIEHQDLTSRPGGPSTPTLHELLAEAALEQSGDSGRLSRMKYECANNMVDCDYRGDVRAQQYRHSEGKVLEYRKAKLSGKAADARQGYLVFTGQPGRLVGPNGNRPRRTKHMEFIFDAEEKKKLEVADDVMRGFLQVHSESADWRFLNSRESPHFKKRGVPVFFLADGDAVRYLGLAQMFRLPGQRTLGEIAAKQQVADDTRLDFVQTLFGYVPTPEERSGLRALKGRVQMGDLLFRPNQDGASPRLAANRFQQQTVLAAPKPSFYPSYFDQAETTVDDKGKRNYHSILSPEAKLRGWKRYPVRHSLEQVELVVPPTQDASSNVRLQPLAPGVRFGGRVRLHNVKREELGAVVWALNFGEGDPTLESELRHVLGMGKPFGFGQVSVKVTKAHIRPNNPDQSVPTLLEVRHSFETWMEGKVPGWGGGSVLKELRLMANPDASGAKRDCLRPLTLGVGNGAVNEFAVAKKKGAVLPAYSAVGPENSSR